MLVVLVANTKGGCGKTTIATHLAAAFATSGLPTALADADRQHGSLAWTERRPAEMPAITGLDWAKRIDDPPRRLARLVIDAPAALKLGQVEDLVALADLLVLPVLPSPFDEAATGRFLERLDELKRVRKSRTGVAVVGNRLRPRTRAAGRLDAFLDGLGHRVVARLRDSALYSDSAAAGLSLFDLGGRRVAEARADWAPLLKWIGEAA